MRAVRHQNTFTQAFKGAGEIDVEVRIRHQRNVGDTVGVERYVDFQLQRFGFHFRLVNAGFVLTMAIADVTDHRIHQREAPQRFRNGQRFAFGAVDVQIHVLIFDDAIGPVWIGNTGFTNRHQIEARGQRQFGILFVHHAANANHRHFRQRRRALFNVFAD